MRMQDLLTPEVVGTAMKFGARENEPFRIFGLPRNLVLEVRLVSVPDFQPGLLTGARTTVPHALETVLGYPRRDSQSHRHA